MTQIRLTDQLYRQAKRRAAKEGFDSVDEYVRQVVSDSLRDQTGNFDHIFTPERLAELQQISADIAAGGKTYSMKEVKEHFEKKRKKWLKDHPN